MSDFEDRQPHEKEGRAVQYAQPPRAGQPPKIGARGTMTENDALWHIYDIVNELAAGQNEMAHNVQMEWERLDRKWTEQMNGLSHEISSLKAIVNNQIQPKEFHEVQFELKRIKECIEGHHKGDSDCEKRIRDLETKQNTFAGGKTVIAAIVLAILSAFFAFLFRAIPINEEHSMQYMSREAEVLAVIDKNESP